MPSLSTADIMADIFAQPKSWGPWGEYLVDVAQRTILFSDLLRQRSEQYSEQKAQATPHALKFDAELVLDARTFARPVNYGLVRIKPPVGVVIDERKRPFIVVDPRAGHGPGIGGFKADSELGVAMQAGHPCYFVGFTPEPMPGQTIKDVMHAEAVFIEKVIELHPEAEGMPCIIGNCQAGWAVMMLAATWPELCGPIIVPGSPLSYWARIEGHSPMRYSGGLLGGSWLAALSSDLGNGKFDGGHLVANFENLNSANTLWSKQYDIWSTIDTGAERYLEFEKWWGGHVNMNAGEQMFLMTYNAPLLQAICGLHATDKSPRRRPGNEPERIAFISERIQELQTNIAKGDGREEVALAAIPSMLPADPESRTELLEDIRRTVSAGGDISEEEAKRLAKIKALFAKPVQPFLARKGSRSVGLPA